MRKEKSRSLPVSTILLLSVLVLVFPTLIRGQDQPASRRRLSIQSGLSSDLVLQMRVMGDRFRSPTKEETALTGRLVTESDRSNTVQILHQRSGLVRIDGLKERGALSFDGNLPWGLADRTDEALLETFVMDTVEGMINSAASGGSLRLVGRRFGPDPRSISKDYTGPYFDIYEVIAPVRSRADRQLRLKRYYFDSDTGFLMSTRYTDPTVSKGLSVETRFADWHEVAGSAYPGLIERYEDGRRIFSFSITTISARRAQDVASFR
jgi:hypothetical protein